MKSFFFLFLCLPMLLFSEEKIGEDLLIRRIYDHLLIKDPSSALDEAEKGMELFGSSEKMKNAYAEALVRVGRSNEAIALFKEKMPAFALLETIGWGVLKEGMNSTQYAVRLSSLVGGFLTQDAKAVDFLLSALHDSNAVLRAVGVQLSCYYGDAVLQEEIVRLFEKEKVFWVQREILKALGKMRIWKMDEELKKIAASDGAMYEDKALAIDSLVDLYDHASLKELSFLLKSPKAGLRCFGCDLAAHFEVNEAKSLILKLLADPRPDVRIAALNACGLYFREQVKLEEVLPLLEHSLNDKTPSVAITACWAGLLLHHPQAEKFLEQWLEHPLEENRRLAAAALASSGSLGVSLAQKWIHKTKDPFVAANLALGLLGQRIEVKNCCDILFHLLKEKKEMWIWEAKEGTLFQVLSLSDIRHLEPIPSYPEAIDAMATLHLLSFLAIEGDARALEGLKHFLSHKHWGIGALAAATLLQEGGEGEMTLVRKLLNDPDENIRIQAALALAFLGKDKSAVPLLIESYKKADRELKERILEALGQIGAQESLPFLFQTLQEPFPLLRVIAASSLIQCLYR